MSACVCVCACLHACVRVCVCLQHTRCWFGSLLIGFLFQGLFSVEY